MLMHKPLAVLLLISLASVDCVCGWAVVVESVAILDGGQVDVDVVVVVVVIFSTSSIRLS